MLNKVFKVIEAILGIAVVVYIALSVIFTTLCLDDIIKLFNS